MSGIARHSRANTKLFAMKMDHTETEAEIEQRVMAEAISEKEIKNIEAFENIKVR